MVVIMYFFGFLLYSAISLNILHIFLIKIYFFIPQAEYWNDGQTIIPIFRLFTSQLQPLWSEIGPMCLHLNLRSGSWIDPQAEKLPSRQRCTDRKAVPANHRHGLSRKGNAEY